MHLNSTHVDQTWNKKMKDFLNDQIDTYILYVDPKKY